MCEPGFKEKMHLHKVIAGLSGEFFVFHCEKCGDRTKVTFLGHELMIPKFESVCKCGEVHRFKAVILGIPKKPIEK